MSSLETVSLIDRRTSTQDPVSLCCNFFFFPGGPLGVGGLFAAVDARTTRPSEFHSRLHKGRPVSKAAAKLVPLQNTWTKVHA